MKKTGILLLLIIIVSAQSLFSQGQEIGIITRIVEYFQKFRSYYPRLEGSAGEEKARKLITSVLNEQGIKNRIIEFHGFEGRHSFSSIVEADIPGKKEDTLIFAVPLSHSSEAEPEEDYSISLALGLGIITQLAETESEPPVSLKFLFLGAEKGQEDYYPMGSRLFLDQYTAENRTAVIYLDMSELPGRVIFETGGNSTVAPKWLVEDAAVSIQNTGLPFLILGNRNQAFRVGLSDTETSAAAFLEADIPAVGIRGRYAADPVEEEQWIASFLEFAGTVINRYENGFPEQWDRHYLFFQIQSSFLIIPENVYVLILLGVLGFSFAYGLIFRNRVGKYLRTVGKNFWNLPLLLGLIFLLLFTSTLIVQGFLQLRGFPELWEFNPLPFFLLKIALAVFLFTFIFHGLRGLPISQKGSFYSAAAIFFLFTDIFIFAAVDVSISYYFVWAFFFAFCFSVTANRLLKTVFFLLSPIWLYKAALDIFTLPERMLSGLAILDAVEGNLFLAFVTLPFMLMLIRLDFVIRHPKRKWKNISLKGSLWISGLLAAGLTGYLIFYSPYSIENPQPVRLEERIDMDLKTRKLTASSPAALGTFIFSYGDRIHDITTRSSSFTFAKEYIPDLVRFTVQEKEFLRRTRIRTVIESEVPLYIYNLRIDSEVEITIYDSNFPPIIMNQGRRVVFNIGKNPPQPLEVVFTVPGSPDFSYSIECISLQTLKETEESNPMIRLEKRLYLQGTVP
ncbi:MAG: M28 family peptidase [Spirochaetia bacterium]